MIVRNLAGLLSSTADSLRVVYHRANASYPRPAGSAPVLWVGTVTPAELAAGDIYAQSTGTAVTPAWAPTSIATLQGWYNPATLALSNGAPLTSWPDSSSLARNLAVVSEAPTYSSEGLGGRPSVAFTTATVGTLDSAVFTAVAGPVTWFLNFQANDLTAIRSLIGGASITDLSIQTRTSGAGYTLRRTNIDLTVNSTLVASTPHTLVVQMNGASSALYFDGTLITSGTLGTGDLTKVRLGRRGDGQQRHNGLLGDVFWMTGVPDAPTLASAHSWLAGRRSA